MGLNRRLIKWLGGDKMIPLKKYEILEQKYKDLVFEFKKYRCQSDIRDRRYKRQISQLNESIKITGDIQDILIRNANLTAKERAEIVELEVEKSKTMFH